MENLIKNALGQWRLVSDMLRKSPEDAPKPVQPIINPDINANSEKLSKLFSAQNEHVIHGRAREAHEVKGQIKDMVLRAPKGSIDIGHLGKLRDTQLKITPPDSGEWKGKRQPLRDEDMEEIISKHLGDAKNLKDIHDNHGGLKTVEAVLKTIGSKANPTFYSGLKFKNPNLHLDMIDLMNPDKGNESTRSEGEDSHTLRAKGIFPKSSFARTAPHPDLHQKVKETWDEMKRNSAHTRDPDEVTNSAHEKAVMDRAIDRFKRHYKL